MATDVYSGLFGSPLSQQELQNQLIEQRAGQMSGMGLGQMGAYLGYKGGAQLGGGLAGLMGKQITDPVVQKAITLRQLAGGIDVSTTEGLQEYAKRLTQAGFQEEAAKIGQQVLAAREKEATILSKTEEKQAQREQTAQLARERMESTKQLAADRNALMYQIAQMNASLRNANTDVQRQLIEQRIEDLKGKAEEKQAQLQSQAQGRVAAFDSAIDTLDVISKHPGKKDVVGAVTGGLMSMVPGTDAAGFAAQLETFKSQTFIPQVAALKGMGALSDAEGKKLTAAVGALDIKMKKKEFDSQVAKIKSELEAARQRAMSMPGMPKQAEQTAAPKKVVKFSDLP